MLQDHEGDSRRYGNRTSRPGRTNSARYDLLPCSVQVRSGRFHQLSLIIKGLACDCHLSVSFLPFLLFNCFTYARYRLDAVTRVVPGSIDLVNIPRSPGQALGCGQLALTLEQFLVNGRERRPCQSRPSVCFGLRQCPLVMLRCPLNPFHTVFEWCKVQVRRGRLRLRRERRSLWVRGGGEDLLLDF